MFKKGALCSLLMTAVLLSAPIAFSAEETIDDRTTASERELPLAAPTSAPAAREANGREAAASVGYSPAAYFAGVMATGNNNFILRITNRGPRAGTATVTFASAATGAVIGTWTSASIPLYAAIQTSIAGIAAAMTPALTSAQLAAPLNISVATTFAPATQLLSANVTTGGIANLSACGSALLEDIYLLGYVEGPGATGPTAAVRLFNLSSRTLAAHLTIYDASSGATLGTWNSQDIPSGGSLTTSMAAIAAAATPVIVATMPAVTILATPTRGLRLEHVVMSNGMLADLTSACSP